MIVVADASPLIFLAKIRQLDLIYALLGRDVRMPQAVRKELFAGTVDPVERDHVAAAFGRENHPRDVPDACEADCLIRNV